MGEADRGSTTSTPLRVSRMFSLVVLVTLGVAGLIGLMVLLMQLQPGFMGMAHFREPHHRIHDLTFGFLFATGVVGILAQVRRPSKNGAGQLMALIPWVGLLLVAVLSTSPFVILSPQSLAPAVLTVFTALLHPTGRDLFRSFSVSRVNRVMLAMVLIAAVPLLALASTNIGLQRTAADDHSAAGHYGFMAAFGFTVIGVGLLASLRPDGWRLTAWVGGLLPVLLGLASVVFPDVESSLGLAWAFAAIAWGVGFGAAAELTRTRMADQPRYRETGDDNGVRPGRVSTTSTPRWAYVVSGAIAIVLILLFIVMHLTGGGVRHTP